MANASSFDPDYENGIPVFRPSFEDFRDFRAFVNRIEPIGMKTGIVKVVPPQEWLVKLPKLATAEIDQIEIKKPITQNLTLGSDRGVFGVENVEKRKKFTIQQWVKQCNNLGNQPPTRRGERQRVLGSFEANPGEFVSYDDSDFSPDMLEQLEAKFWKGLAYGGSPMYGADLPGSLFTEKTKEWNVAHLDSLLSALPEVIPGVNDAYLYCGMWKAMFAWHLEDMDLPSINYIHFGAPKQWYTIPQSHHQQFYELMSALWPDEQRKCSEFLRHKTFLADPTFIRKQGIPVNQIVHRQQEFMITFPYGYHSGFNYGFNIAESVNFAHDSWLDIGTSAKKCTCVSHSVGIDVQKMIDMIKSSGKVAGKTPDQDKWASEMRIKPKRLGKCVLCPSIYTGDYLHNKERTASVHLACANLTPETYIVGKDVHGLASIPKDRFGLKCSYCKTTLGSCFQCSERQCTRAYHGSCAAAAGVEYHDIHKPRCRYHRAKRDNQLDPSCLIPGDVVQFFQELSYGAGIVNENIVDEQEVKILRLPNPSETAFISYNEITSVFADIPHGPFVEALIPLSKGAGNRQKRTASSPLPESTGMQDSRNHERDYFNKRVKKEEGVPSLLSPPTTEDTKC